MGNREDLLAGARQCLLEKGYVQTTARDIANASGVSLAAIGYHFGSKEALLQEAMVEANVDWGARVAAAVESMKIPPGASWASWFEHVWEGIIASTETDKRMLQASLEVLLNVDEASPVCSSIDNGMSCASEGLFQIFGHDDDEMTPEQAQAVGSFYLALEIGVRLLHSAKPVRAPTPHDLVLALQTIAPRVCENPHDEETVTARQKQAAD